MRRMDLDELSRLKIELVTCETELEPGQRSQAVVRIHNDSQSTICSVGEFPIKLAFHLYDQNGTIVLFEGPRSDLFPPLLSGQSYSYKVQFAAPAEQGNYILRLTLVQEAVV